MGLAWDKETLGLALNLGFLCPTKKFTGSCGRGIALGSTSDAREGIAFGFTWDALGLRGARKREIANVFAKQQQCPHEQCSKRNCHVLQDLTLCSTAKAVVAAAPPLYGEEEGGRSGGACCYVYSVYNRNSTLPITNFCSKPHFFPERTG